MCIGDGGARPVTSGGREPPGKANFGIVLGSDRSKLPTRNNGRRNVLSNTIGPRASGLWPGGSRPEVGWNKGARPFAPGLRALDIGACGAGSRVPSLGRGG